MKFGGFDSSFKTASGEDPELSFKIFSAGNRLLFDTGMFVWHTHPNSMKKYIKQQFYRAYWRVNLYNKHPQKMGGDVYTGSEIPLSPALMSIFLISAVSGTFLHEAFYVSVFSLLAFFTLYGGFFRFVSKAEPSLLPKSMMIIFLRTVSWLLGFVYGLKLLTQRCN
jgi:GT2 family glycosyltransferase